MSLEEMGQTLCAAMGDDAGVSAQAIGVLALYLRDRVDGGARRITLEDVSGSDEDQAAIEELLDAGMLVVVLPAGDPFESVFLPSDPQAAAAASAEQAIAYLFGDSGDIDSGDIDGGGAGWGGWS
jgi:hypothetical protein